MDKLVTNRSIDYYCGNGIANEVVADYIVKRNGGTPPKIAILSDREVSGYYYNRFEEQFLKLRIKPVLICEDLRNNSKGLTTADRLFKNLVDFDFGSDDWLIGLGGGGVLDMCGFASSIFNGGINFMAVPTTMTSMTEGVLARSSYLNSSGHKNEIISGFDPQIAVIDPMFLHTVPAKVKAGGYATIIRLALLQDLELLSGIDNRSDFRVYLNSVYKAYAAVEKKDPLLLTLGNELAESIESYFRFMNYSSGEALALSLLTLFDDRKREVLKKIYQALGLPTVLTGCTEKMIMKTAADRFSHHRESVIKMADIVNGKWCVAEYTREEALDVIAARLKRIIDQGNIS